MAEEGFEARFGQLVRTRRGIKGLSQRRLAALVFGDENRQQQISALERGKVRKLPASTVDALVTELAIPENEVDACRAPFLPAPTVPAQVNSAHFTIIDGLIATVPTQQFDQDENDYPRLEALQAPLLDSVRKAEAALSRGNKAHAPVLDIVEKYRDALQHDTQSINYAVLYAYGLQLSIACESAEQLIQKGELPDFDLETLAATQSIIQLHGPFILSSKDGRDLVTDAERYERMPAEERAFQSSVKEFGDLLSGRTDIVEKKAAEFIQDITKPDDGGGQFERRYLFSKGAAKNLVIVLSAGAVVASTAFIPVVGPYVAASLGLLTLEATKQSKPFNALSSPITQGMDALSSVDMNRLKEIPREQLQKLREFVIENRDLLRKVGGSAREMQWFRNVLDWIDQSESKDDSSLGETVTPVIPEMVEIPPGEFLMGSLHDDDAAVDREMPQHKVTISYRLAVGRYPVTFDEYDAFCQATGRDPAADHGWGRDRRPVINVSWDDAQAYVEWLSGETGRRYRLLTEAEWEYACRAGSTTRYSFGDDDGDLGEYGWFEGNVEGKTHPVGEKLANAFELFDMHGNVWEWVEDAWHENYIGAPDDGTAWTEGDDKGHRVLRGGSWNDGSGYLRSASRIRVGTDIRDDDIGFRVARTPDR